MNMMQPAVCDESGNTTRLFYDRNGRITKVVRPAQYDPGQDDGAGIRYEYDTDDHRIRIHYPDGGTERIQYDANGNIIKRSQPTVDASFINFL